MAEAGPRVERYFCPKLDFDGAPCRGRDGITRRRGDQPVRLWPTPAVSRREEEQRSWHLRGGVLVRRDCSVLRSEGSLDGARDGVIAAESPHHRCVRCGLVRDLPDCHLHRQRRVLDFGPGTSTARCPHCSVGERGFVVVAFPAGRPLWPRGRRPDSACPGPCTTHAGSSVRRRAGGEQVALGDRLRPDVGVLPSAEWYEWNR
jgi:hypothetical protein